MVFQRMEVAAGAVVVPGESVTGPEHHHIGALLQDILDVAGHVLGPEIRLFRGFPSLILPREIALELLVLGDDARHRVLAVVEYAGHLGPALHQGGSQEAEGEDDGHGDAEDQPALQFGEFLFAHISVILFSV